MGMLLRLVQSGGMAKQLRPQVWPLLLGCFLPDDDNDVCADKWRAAEVEFKQLWALAQDTPAATQHFADKVCILRHCTHTCSVLLSRCVSNCLKMDQWAAVTHVSGARHTLGSPTLHCDVVTGCS